MTDIPIGLVVIFASILAACAEPSPADGNRSEHLVVAAGDPGAVVDHFWVDGRSPASVLEALRTVDGAALVIAHVTLTDRSMSIDTHTGDRVFREHYHSVAMDDSSHVGGPMLTATEAWVHAPWEDEQILSTGERLTVVAEQHANVPGPRLAMEIFPGRHLLALRAAGDAVFVTAALPANGEQVTLVSATEIVEERRLADVLAEYSNATLE